MKLLRTGRYLRLAKVTSARWQRRTIFLLGGIAVGAAAVVLALLADRAQAAFALLLAKSHYASLVVTPAGFMLSVFLTNRYFQNSQGSGIPQAIAARRLTDQAARGRLVSIRIAIGKILLTLLGLLCVRRVRLLLNYLIIVNICRLIVFLLIVKFGDGVGIFRLPALQGL